MDDEKNNSLDLRAKLTIEKINLNKYVNHVQTKDIQKSIDQGYLATPNKFSDDNIYIFAHYTNVENTLFNSLPLLKVGDEILLSNNSDKIVYEVEKLETIEKETLFEKESDLILVTCTKKFDKNKYLCVYAKRLEI